MNSITRIFCFPFARLSLVLGSINADATQPAMHQKFTLSLSVISQPPAALCLVLFFLALLIQIFCDFACMSFTLSPVDGVIHEGLQCVCLKRVSSIDGAFLRTFFLRAYICHPKKPKYHSFASVFNIVRISSVGAIAVSLPTCSLCFSLSHFFYKSLLQSTVLVAHWHRHQKTHVASDQARARANHVKKKTLSFVEVKTEKRY